MKKSLSIQIHLAACLLLIVADSGYGAESGLTLEEALRLASRHDASIYQASLEVESGDALVREAYSAALPRLDMSGSLTHFMQAPSSYIPAFDERVRFAPLYNASGALQLAQPLWLAGKIGLALDAAKVYRLIARDGLSNAKSRLKAEVIREYYGLLLAREVVRVSEESLAQAARHSESVGQMYEVGVASEFDLLRSQVQVKALEPELSAARKGAELAAVALKNRLGLPPDGELLLVDELDAERAVVEAVDAQWAYQRAVEQRAEFRILDRQERLNDIGLKVQQHSLYWPNFYLGVGYSQEAGQDKLDALKEGSTWAGSATWTLSAAIPLFDGFATQARIQQARIGLRKTELARRQVSDGVRLEVTAALAELRRAGEQLASARSAVELAEKAHTIALASYEAGVGTELEVLDAQLAMRAAKLGMLQGFYDQRVAEAEYRRVVENDDVLPEER